MMIIAVTEVEWRLEKSSKVESLGGLSPWKIDWFELCICILWLIVRDKLLQRNIDMRERSKDRSREIRKKIKKEKRDRDGDDDKNWWKIKFN